MILETVRIVADWLTGAMYGVNAMLATVPLDGTDTRPASVTVFDETRDGPTARRKVPATKPCLLVRQQDDATADGEPYPVGGPRQAHVTLGLWYADTQSASETGNRNTHYVLRAARESLRRLTDPTDPTMAAAATTAKTRGSIQLLKTEAVRAVTAHEPLEDSLLLGALFVTFTVRDTAP